MKTFIALVMVLTMMVFTSSSEAAELVIRPTEQLPQVVVRENFIQLATTKLESVLRENGEVRRHKIEAVNVPAGARLPAGRIDYETFIPNGIRYGNRTQVWININVNGEKYTQIRCTMKISVFENMITAAHQIKPEKPLTEDDIRFEEREIGLRNYVYYTKVEDVLGKVVNKAVTEGTILYRHILWEPVVIEPGMPVTIRANVNGIQVTTEGVSRSKGRIGQRIRVLNSTSKKIIIAKVIDANTVSIGE